MEGDTSGVEDVPKSTSTQGNCAYLLSFALRPRGREEAQERALGIEGRCPHLTPLREEQGQNDLPNWRGRSSTASHDSSFEPISSQIPEGIPHQREWQEGPSRFPSCLMICREMTRGHARMHGACMSVGTAPRRIHVNLRVRRSKRGVVGREPHLHAPTTLE